MAATTTRTILVMAPMTSELAAVRRAFGLKAGTAQRGRTTVVAVLGGVGPAAAAASTERAVAVHRPDHVVVVGIAGGLVGQTIGTVVCPDRVVDHSSGATWRASPLGTIEPSGALATTDGLLDPDALDGLGPIDAVDMESAAVAQVADRHGLGWTAVRAISDRPDDGMVDERVSRLVRADGSPDLVAVARYLLPAPWRGVRLARLGRDSQRAANSAAHALAAALGW